MTVLVTGTALFAMGCGSPEATPTVADVGPAKSSPSPSAAATERTRGDALAYARCMRAHGVKKFPDPSADGGFNIQARPGDGMGPDNPTFKAAQKACQHLLPAPSAADRAKMHADALKYSTCMRSHGIKDFPDPNPDGGMMLKARPGSGLDPNSPRFKAADKACQHLLPGRKGGGPRTLHGEKGSSA